MHYVVNILSQLISEKQKVENQLVVFINISYYSSLLLRNTLITNAYMLNFILYNIIVV